MCCWDVHGQLWSVCMVVFGLMRRNCEGGGMELTAGYAGCLCGCGSGQAVEVANVDMFEDKQDMSAGWTWFIFGVVRVHDRSSFLTLVCEHEEELARWDRFSCLKLLNHKWLILNRIFCLALLRAQSQKSFVSLTRSMCVRL